MKFSLHVYEFPIDATQKRCLKCPPSAQTYAMRWRCHWHTAATVIEWSILAHSVRHFVYHQQHNVTSTSSQSKSSSGVVVKFK